MFALTKILSSLRLLADALAMLAGTVNTIDQQLRDRLQLDAQDGPPAAQVLDQGPAAVQTSTPADPAPIAGTNGLAVGRRGKGRPAAAGEQ